MAITREDFDQTPMTTGQKPVDTPRPKPTLFAGLDGLRPITDLWLRLVVAWAFYTSGLTKVTSNLLIHVFGTDLRYPTSLHPTFTTQLLFQNEYHVPLLSPALAAQLGPVVEIGMPVLIALGLFGRPAAIILFVFNIVAVLSYQAAQSGPAFYLHVLWGTLLLAVIAHGPGKISIDYLFARLFRRG